jgi:hypothetical protein
MIKKTSDDESVTLNFRVHDDFRWRYKVYAAENGLMMNWVLQRSFEVYKGLVELGMLNREVERRLLRDRFKTSQQDVRED